MNIQVSHLFTRCVLDIGLFVAFTTFLLLPLWILYVWITGLDPELHATNPAETWGQQAHDALIANESYSKNREGKRKCSSSHCVSQSLSTCTEFVILYEIFQENLLLALSGRSVPPTNSAPLGA